MPQIDTISIRESDGTLKNIGEIFNKTFFKKVKASKHLYRKTNSWGIDAEVFNKIVSIECNVIKILDLESNFKYKTTVDTFKKYGQYLQFNPHRLQIFLTLDKFEKYK